MSAGAEQRSAAINEMLGSIEQRMGVMGRRLAVVQLENMDRMLQLAFALTVSNAAQICKAIDEASEDQVEGIHKQANEMADNLAELLRDYQRDVLAAMHAVEGYDEGTFEVFKQCTVRLLDNHATRLNGVLSKIVGGLDG